MGGNWKEEGCMIMNIAVCDDQPEVLDILAKISSNYFSNLFLPHFQKKTVRDLKCISNGDKL